MCTCSRMHVICKLRIESQTHPVASHFDTLLDLLLDFDTRSYEPYHPTRSKYLQLRVLLILIRLR